MNSPTRHRYFLALGLACLLVACTPPAERIAKQLEAHCAQCEATHRPVLQGLLVEMEKEIQQDGFIRFRWPASLGHKVHKEKFEIRRFHAAGQRNLSFEHLRQANSQSFQEFADTLLEICAHHTHFRDGNDFLTYLKERPCFPPNAVPFAADLAPIIGDSSRETNHISDTTWDALLGLLDAEIVCPRFKNLQYRIARAFDAMHAKIVQDTARQFQPPFSSMLKLHAHLSSIFDLPIEDLRQDFNVYESIFKARNAYGLCLSRTFSLRDSLVLGQELTPMELARLDSLCAEAVVEQPGDAWTTVFNLASQRADYIRFLGELLDDAGRKEALPYFSSEEYAQEKKALNAVNMRIDSASKIP